MHDMLNSFIEFTQVREHLELFAILKGVEEHSLDNAVINMADEVSSVIRSLNNFCFYHRRP